MTQWTLARWPGRSVAAGAGCVRCGCRRGDADESHRWGARLGQRPSRRPDASKRTSGTPRSFGACAVLPLPSRDSTPSKAASPVSIPPAADVAATKDLLDEAAGIAGALRALGLEPVLVGGMALVILGSRRVTRDFDFVIAHPGDRLKQMIDLFYDRGLELASCLNDDGDVSATISTRRVASVRLRLDAPSSAYFLNPRTGLRVDLLFDFPVPASALAAAATPTKVRSWVFHVASEPDLLQLKRIAQASRASAGDAQDVAFLEARRRTRE